ncbi:uncharacterized protein JCM15063_005304 [Sporobolomyces koalae]|uniref:uncharacterized protein n=1 Tax=Sporobolomyces koalae TaxID=500713 RepID=UPI00316EBB95
MSGASRTGTPQPWQQQQSQSAASGSGGLQLPKGKAMRSGSQEPNGNDGGHSGKATNVNSLMDAVGASGVDLGAEEESLRASNERAHLQAMALAAAAAANGGPGSGSNVPPGTSAAQHQQLMQQYAYNGIDRSRKQDFIDPSVLAECVKKVAAAFQLKTLEPDTIPLIALATRQRLQTLINLSISARDHRQNSSHFKPPPFVVPRKTKKRRRNRPDRTDDQDDEMNGLEEDDDDEDDDDDDDNDEEEEEEVEEPDGTIRKKKRPRVPAWDALVYDDPERYLTVLERVDRAEEAKHRKERMTRDVQDQREREVAEEQYAAELARKAIEQDQQQADSNGGGTAGTSAEGESGSAIAGLDKDAGGKGKGKAKNAADRFLASNQPSDSAPSTPTKELGKDGKPKKKKKPKNVDGTPSGAGGTSTPGGATPGTSTPSATSIAKNMSEDARKRLTDSSAMKSLGGTKYSWMNAGGLGSPSPGLGSGGISPFLGKPKFAPASSFGPGGGGISTSSLNPANNSSLTLHNSPSTELANALTTSRLNVPPLHDAQRTKIARDQWESGHHVVELGDLLFAMDHERGAGVGRGAGRNAAVRGRAGVTRGGSDPTTSSLAATLTREILHELIADITIEEYELSQRRRHRLHQVHLDSLQRGLVENGTGTSNGTNGASPTKKDRDEGLFNCVVCNRQIAAPRYASHLSGCMGLSGSRRGERRAAATASSSVTGKSATRNGSGASSHGSDTDTEKKNGINVSATSSNGAFQPPHIGSHPLSKTMSLPSSPVGSPSVASAGLPAYPPLPPRPSSVAPGSLPSHHSQSAGRIPPPVTASSQVRASHPLSQQLPPFPSAPTTTSSNPPRSKQPAVHAASSNTNDRPDSDSEDSDDSDIEILQSANSTRGTRSAGTQGIKTPRVPPPRTGTASMTNGHGNPTNRGSSGMQRNGSNPIATTAATTGMKQPRKGMQGTGSGGAGGISRKVARPMSGLHHDSASSDDDASEGSGSD